MEILYAVILAIISGILGRLGGATGYNTKYRDIGCSVVTIITTCLIVGYSSYYWWIFFIVFGLQWAFFSTYWDVIFKYDNLWFSGFMAGLCFLPLITVGIFKSIGGFVWWLILIRAIVLALIWGSLNKYLPKKVSFWRRDVAEEFLRYASLPLTVLILS